MTDTSWALIIPIVLTQVENYGLKLHVSDTIIFIFYVLSFLDKFKNVYDLFSSSTNIWSNVNITLNIIIFNQ